MNVGLQRNNFSPMGQGQPAKPKKRPQDNWMTQAFGEQQSPIIEAVAPGTPEPGSLLPPPAAAMTQTPTNSTMPVSDPVRQGVPSVPQSFQGQGTGWRGLDTTPISGNVDRSRFQGFNLDRAFAGGDPNSVKDTFARWAAGINTPLTGLSKDQVGQVIRSNIDRARQMGLNILDIQGDKILIDAREHGPVWTDVVADAGGVNPQWWWNPELGQDGTLPKSAPAAEMYNFFQSQLAPQQNQTPEIDEMLMALLSQNQELI